jgi:hypothetical protein
MRRSNKETYAASFSFSAENEDVKFRENYENGQGHLVGTDIAAVRVYKKKGEVEELPEFGGVDVL